MSDAEPPNTDQPKPAIAVVLKQPGPAPSNGTAIKKPDPPHKTHMSGVDRAIQVLVFLAASTYAAIAGLELHEMRQSNAANARLVREGLDKTQVALQVSRRQLEATDRPWLDVTVEEIGPVTFGHGSNVGQVSSRLRIVNVGKSAATDINIMSEIGLAPEKERSPGSWKRSEMSGMCDWADGMQKNNLASVNGALFPGEFATSSGTESFGDKTLQDALWTFAPGFLGRWSGKVVSPKLIGCVSYRFTYSQMLHHTGFTYGISERTTLNGSWPFLVVGRNVPAGRLFVTHELFSTARID